MPQGRTDYKAPLLASLRRLAPTNPGLARLTAATPNTFLLRAYIVEI